MPISDSTIANTLADYLEFFPAEAAQLSTAMRLLREGKDISSRRTFPMHATASALLVRNRAEVLLVEHLDYGITLQPGGHCEDGDETLLNAAVRELVEETDVDPGMVIPASTTPVYVEFGLVPARPHKDEPEHYHLDFGYLFETSRADVGSIQESEVTGAAWYPLATAERRVGSRIARAVSAPARSS